jgi:hypothetical protein
MLLEHGRGIFHRNGRYVIHTRMNTDSFGWGAYTTDFFDEIKPEHKGICAMLDAARNEGSHESSLDGVGHAFYYGNQCPSYYIHGD